GFTFDVRRNGPIGVGARADSDVVTTTIWSADGRELGSGVVQMPQLSPGRYILAIHVPPASPPVAVRPALSGIEPPSLDPPDAATQPYPAREGEGASFSATRGARPRVASPEEETPGDEAEDEEEPSERTPHP